MFSPLGIWMQSYFLGTEITLITESNLKIWTNVQGDCGMETNISSNFDRNEIKRCHLIAKTRSLCYM
jgi:hypothetical protein